MTRSTMIACAIVGALLASSSAWATEICGNGIDDDANGRTDEGCASTLVSGQCESPLSCADTGMVSPLKGALRYQLPADVAPKVPWGPGIGLRRYYVSQYAPGSSAPVWQQPLGERWHHTYMAWLTKTGSGASAKIVLHHQGQDILASYSSTGSGWDTYTPQAGFHVKALRQRTTSPNEFQLITLTGETFIYNSSGRLTEIWDAQGGAYTQKVLLAYDGNGQVSTVTDASGTRRLLFGYTGNQLTSVQFQVVISSSWTTQHTTSYAYASGNLSTVTIGGALAQTNSYTSNYLTQIQDGGGKTLVSFAYTPTAGQVARVDTAQGMIGFDYASSRSACSGKTVLYFNRGNATSCSVDGDCGSGFLCGGKTGTGSTGVCFRAARCLTTSSPSEDLITDVAALGPPSESCTGACATVTQYVWSGTGSLDNTATQDATGVYTTRVFNSNGMVTQITYGDPDANATNGNEARTEWRYYGDANFPGKVTEIRRRSDLATNASQCSSSNTKGCMQMLYTYKAPGTAGGGRVATVTQTGTFELNASGNPSGTPNSYVTTYSYDSLGRVTQIDGPLAGSDDVTNFEYHSSTGPLVDGFLSRMRRKKDGTKYLDQSATDYDFWGNPTTLVDADGTLTCLTFSTSRGVLTERREAMNGQTSCTPGTDDLVTSWDRDSALRLVKLTRPDGSCLFFEYDGKGRLQRTKRRDDCNASSPGDKQEFVRDDEGLVTEVQVYDASNTLTTKQGYAYFDSRRLEKSINPVNTSTWTGITYDARGLVSQLDAEGGLGKTVFERTGTPGDDGRITAVKKYNSSTVFDTWSLLYSWLGDQTSVTDGDSKQTTTLRDDLGRVVKLGSVDMTYPIVRRYDAASRLYQVQEGFGGGSTNQRDHSFTFDNLGRPLNDNFSVGHSSGTCGGETNPAEIQRIYDRPSSCPIDDGEGCTNTAGRLAYVKVRLMCVFGLPPDYSLDQETWYGYDAAGRVVVEYITDDAGRVALQEYAWTPNGELRYMLTPTGHKLNWDYGSTGSNSDTDRITAISKDAGPVINAITWHPYGPVAQYNQQNSYGGVGLRSRFTRNLAYRPTGAYMETQDGSTVLHQLALTEDDKGRVTSRDFTSTVSGVRDSYFLYDDQDRVLCETTNVVSTCPTSGSNLKNNHAASPPFMVAGDWKQILRPIPGTSSFTNNIGIVTGKHQLSGIDQPDLDDYVS